MPKKPKLGSGKRFANLTKSIAKEGNVENPAAVAASIGRKKYGAKKMAKLSAAGKKASKQVFMYDVISTRFQDATSLLIKVQIMHDLVSYNSTLLLGKRYQDWLDTHECMIEDLITMLEEDIKAIEEPNDKEVVTEPTYCSGCL